MTHLNTLVLTTGFLLAGRVAAAQVPNSLDSVLVYLSTHTQQDTNYVRALNVMGRELHSTGIPNYVRADSALQASEQLARTLNYGRGLAKAYTNRASIYYLTDQYPQALDFFQRALATAQTHKLDLTFVCGAIVNVAAAQSKLRQYDKAVNTLLQSAQLQEQHNLQPRLSATYGGLGNAFLNLKKPREAIPYYQQAIILSKQPDNSSGLAIWGNKLGICYDDLKQYDNSINFYKRALTHARLAKFTLLEADILVNIGLALRLSKRPREGLPFVERSMAIGKVQGNKGTMATAYFNLGQIYEELKQYRSAEENLKKALSLARERNNPEQIANYTQGLADLYGGMNDFQQAYTFQLEKNQRTDSATTVRTNAEVQRLVARYETEKKEARIKLLQQEKQLQREETRQAQLRTNALLLGAVLLLLLGAAISAWLLNRSRLRRLLEAQTLRRQIAHDLHDEVGSTLSSISILSGHTDALLTQRKPGTDTSESAQKMVQKIYTDARQILESMDEIIWTINPGNDSLERIALRLREYAQPLMESKGIRFCFQIDPVLDGVPISMEVRRNLYLIGKEAINNLVKYSQATDATLRFDRRDHQLRVLIEDNGRGFDATQSSQRNGQASMQQRAKEMGGLLNVESEPGQGTRLQLTLST